VALDLTVVFYPKNFMSRQFNRLEHLKSSDPMSLGFIIDSPGGSSGTESKLLPEIKYGFKLRRN
jgi:hypothetical protein